MKLAWLTDIHLNFVRPRAEAYAGRASFASRSTSRAPARGDLVIGVGVFL